jgi:L-ascorbate metabolism protein UlaG (beta-lactamase superfamily)
LPILDRLCCLKLTNQSFIINFLAEYMRRRQFIFYTATSLLTTTSLLAAPKPKPTETPPKGKVDNSLLVQWLGHSCFLFTGGGQRVLVNPFRAIGCTAGFRVPRVEADLVLISSQLWDEGAAENLPGNPKILFEPGAYEIGSFKLQGISIAHDRQGGKRFGMNVAWRWTQAGINIVHLGGAAAPIELEQRILLGATDLALIPVGGGPKNYNPEEAKQVIEVLQPKIAIPTQFLTSAADPKACDLVSVEEFLKLVKGKNIQLIEDDRLRVRKADLPQKGTLIRVFDYKRLLQKT